MESDLFAWIADALVLLGILIMTLAVYGIFRMPDVYTSLHAASKALTLGILPILLALILTFDLGAVSRAVLIGFFLLLTTPVASHVIGRAAYLQNEPMRSPDCLDESGRLAPPCD